MEKRSEFYLLFLSMSAKYLISAPSVLHPGTPTSLAVTILTNDPVRVTAELTNGNTSLVQAESTFTGGDIDLYDAYCKITWQDVKLTICY